MKLTEGQIIEMVTEELKKSDVLDIVKHDKDFEKNVKKIISDTLSEFFRILWQHNGFFKGLVK